MIPTYTPVVEEKQRADPILVVFVFALTFCNRYILCVCLLIIALFLVALKQYKFYKTRLPGCFFVFLIMLQCSITGVYGLGSHVFSFWPFFRDLMLVLLIPCFWFASQFFLCRFKVRKYDFEYSFVVSCTLICIFKSIESISSLKTGLMPTDRVDEWLISISLFLIICHYAYIFYKRRWQGIFSVLIIFVQFIISFSRISIIIVLILLFGQMLRRPRVLIKVSMSVSIFISLGSFFFKEQFTLLQEKFLRSITEVSSRDTWNADQVVWDWRGFEVFCAKAKYADGDLLNKIFGWGFGSEIDAFGYAGLVTHEDSLPFLHHGYYTMLIKGGALGLLLCFCFYAALIKKIISQASCLYNGITEFAMVIAMLIATSVIRGLFFEPNFYWLFFFSYLLKRSDCRISQKANIAKGEK